MKIIYIVGARPNMMKVTTLIAKMRENKEMKALLVHTGQHYDNKMSKIFFEDLDLPQPDIYLGVGSGSHAQQTSRVMLRLEKVFLNEKPDLVVVVGDVNSTLASAITAVKLHIPLAHIEAGLRSFDMTMPEEINRIVTDHVSDYLFAPSQDAVRNLKYEGISDKKIFFVGNIMIDTLLEFKEKSEKRSILETLGLQEKEYITLTLHRPTNVDNKENILKIFKALKEIQKKIKIVFPMHPRTENMVKKYRLLNIFKNMKNLIIIQPLGYLDFLKLLCNSRLVLTDSGGIQEETTALRIPCITLRDRTERPITVTVGTNVLVGNNIKKIISVTENIIKDPRLYGCIPKFWDGMTTNRIISIILRKFF